MTSSEKWFLVSAAMTAFAAFQGWMVLTFMWLFNVLLFRWLINHGI